ncbi:MAG: AMP-binding protein, partial [Akkermansiaceae bacterium]|nr:AMP-binding protein [Akkermansiaceae bacterium]
KLPMKVAETFREKFGKDVFEGYGLTETSPVTNFNLPDLVPSEEAGEVVSSFRLGTVGHPVSGLAVRVANPDTNEFQPVDQAGIICLKGANVFRGYYNDPVRTREAIKDG